MLLVAFKKAKLNLRDLRIIFANTARTSAQLYLIVGFAMLLGWILAIESVPRHLSDFLSAQHLSIYLILLLINIFLLIVGCFVSDVVQIVLFAPILGPMLVSMGMHPVHFGVMMVVNVVMGMITPPYGTGLYLVSAITGEKLTRIAKETVPFICSSIIVLLIVTYCPKIVLFLPRVTGFIK